jgi:TorA maturation chaperone TorD
VHLSKQRVIFTEGTLAVREFYRSEGMLPEAYPHVSDDHIALELDFMRMLVLRSQEQREQGNAAEFQRLCSAQARFLDEHLLKWTPLYANRLEQHYPGYLYTTCARLLQHLLAFDCQILADIVVE